MLVIAFVASLVLAGTDHSGLVIEAPSVPENRTVAVDSGGGIEAGEATGYLSGRWQVTNRLALTAGVSYLRGEAGPNAGLRLKLVDGLTAGVRLKSEGFEPEGAEVEASMIGGLSLGKLDLMGSATVGYGEETVDVEGAAAARTTFSRIFDLGVEGRYRGATNGTKHDLVAGPAFGVTFAGGTVRVQALAGYASNEKDRGVAAFLGLAVYN
ncbi:MAG: hypothetical protein QM704_23700 [Anaeromyxobacteraceae bacterium]